jgi:hypothetical protein
VPSRDVAALLMDATAATFGEGFPGVNGLLQGQCRPRQTGDLNPPPSGVASEERHPTGQGWIGTELFSGGFPKLDQMPFRLIW